jgi:hypothetical protein
MFATVIIIVAIEAADVPILMVSAVLNLFLAFLEGTTISQPG